MLPFKIGDSSVKGDWIYINNLVLALILASMGLLDDIPEKERRLIAAGQTYFVSDGKNNLHRPLLKVEDIGCLFYSNGRTIRLRVVLRSKKPLLLQGFLSTVLSSFDLFFKAWTMTCRKRL